MRGERRKEERRKEEEDAEVRWRISERREEKVRGKRRKAEER